MHFNYLSHNPSRSKINELKKKKTTTINKYSYHNKYFKIKNKSIGVRHLLGDRSPLVRWQGSIPRQTSVALSDNPSTTELKNRYCDLNPIHRHPPPPIAAKNITSIGLAQIINEADICVSVSRKPGTPPPVWRDIKPDQIMASTVNIIIMYQLETIKSKHWE